MLSNSYREVFQFKGFTAPLLGTVPSVIFGGAMTLLICGTRQRHRRDSSTPNTLRVPPMLSRDVRWHVHAWWRDGWVSYRSTTSRRMTGMSAGEPSVNRFSRTLRIHGVFHGGAMKEPRDESRVDPSGALVFLTHEVFDGRMRWRSTPHQQRMLRA